MYLCAIVAGKNGSRPMSTSRLSFTEIQDYLTDAAQRNVLLLDTLLDCGNA